MLTEKIKDDFSNLLIKEGMKLTSSRLSILDNILSNDSHRECDQIYEDLINDDVKVSRATIYRTLDVLVKYDYVRKLDIGDGKVRYEKKLGTKHHDHMICIETGDIIEFHNNEIEDLQDKIAERHGYKIVRHVHQLFVKPLSSK
ncbi:MAG: transcriptional repressor [Candidatus Marinimicrobia bacterium]|nr:transcriptional repressor [Candidatus Neomarinimicrobiota bacterium]|tara:strand:+ start:1839 stop:2270 length:432 start_codon:yes stop_codon:yes gene_type:complete